MTKNLKIYLAFCLIWSVLFFSVLHWCLFMPEKRGLIILIAAITYGIGFGVSGFLFGKMDSARATRLNLGFAYSLASNVASLFVGGLWILIYRRDEWFALLIMTAIFSTFSLIAWLSSRRSIKGMENKELFK